MEIPSSVVAPQPQVWGLIDDRPGTARQVEGVVEHLGYPFVYRRFTFNKRAKLPNFLLGATISHIEPDMSDRLEPPIPDIIVSAGRRLAPVAQFVRQSLNPRAYLAHIMDPEMDFKRFNLVVLPYHDRPRARGNIYRTLGAPHPIKYKDFEEVRPLWQHTIGSLPSPRVAVLVGGDTSHGKFTVEEADELIEIAKRAAGRGSLLVTTSYRTSPAVVTRIRDKLMNVPHHFFSYGSNAQNPYLAYLAYADTIFVTGDSVSMCSEACYTGKPVYVYYAKGAMSRKHKTLISMLAKEQAVKHASEYSVVWRGGRPLDEAEKIATQIRLGYVAKRKSNA